MFRRCGFGDVLFLRLVIPAFILAEVNLVGIDQVLHEFLHAKLVARFGGADKVVVGDVQLGPERLEVLAVFVGHRFGGDVLLRSGFDHLNAVLVRASEKVDLVAHRPAEPREHVGCDRRVRVAYVRRVVDIVNGRRDVKGVSHGRSCAKKGQGVGNAQRQANLRGRGACRCASSGARFISIHSGYWRIRQQPPD